MGSRSISCWTRGSQRVNPDVGLVQDGRGEAAFLFEEGEQQVFDIDLLISMLDGDGLGRADSLLELFGESVEVHDDSVPLTTS